MKIFAAGVDKTTLDYLRQQGIVADEAEGIERPEEINDCLTDDHDALVMDISRYGWSFYVARYIRTKHLMPVIGISKGSQGMPWSEERAHWLEQGGDDYLRGPPNPRELGAVLRAFTRRTKQVLVDFREYEHEGAHLRVDLGTQRVTVNGVAVHLTAKERMMVATLAAHNGRVVSKDKFLSSLYLHEQDVPEVKIIDVFICKIRKKFGAVHPAAESLIQTVWGTGYTLSIPPPIAQAEPAKVA